MRDNCACSGVRSTAAGVQVRMTSCLFGFLAAVLLLQVQTVAGQTSNFACVLSGGYITGTTPSQLEATVTFQTGIFVPTKTVKLTFSAAVFQATSVPNVVVGGGPASPPTFTTLTNGAGTELTLTLVSGAVGATETLIFYVTSQLAALPVPGAITLTASSTEDTAGTAVPVFNVVAAPTITLTSGNLNINTIPFELRIEYFQPFAVTSGDQILLRANRAVFAGSQTTGLVATGLFSSSYTTDATGTMFTITTSAGINVGQALDMKLRSPLMAALPNHVGPVFLKIEIATRAVFGFTSGFGTIVDPTPPPPPPPPAPPGPSPVSGDPVTYYDGKKIEFVLPWGTFTPMLQTPHMEVLALPIPGKDEDEQWIGRIIVKSASGEHAVQVDIKKKIDILNQTAAPPNVFETIDVTLPWLHPKPLVNLPPRDILYFRQDIDIVFGKIPKTGHGRSLRSSQSDMPMSRREAVVVISPSVKILITSSSAWEWYGKTAEAIRFAHLDMEVFDMHNESSFGGILPELWGIRTLSAKCKAMLKPLKPDKSGPALELV